MAHIRIVWLTDVSPDCETCGSSYAEGAKVWIDGGLALDLSPAAHCFGGTSYSQEDVFAALLERLGHTLEASHDEEVP